MKGTFFVHELIKQWRYRVLLEGVDTTRRTDNREGPC